MDLPIETIAQLFKILADPVRLRIIEGLSMECASVSAIVEATNLSQPLVSNHLRVLRQAGIVRADPRDGYTYYCLRVISVWETVEECCQLLKRIKKISPEDGEPILDARPKTGRKKVPI